MTEHAADDGTDSPGGATVPFISRVRLKNYKSIASCDVRLGPLTILVGPNGSGKSNFLDALAFLSRALETTPGEAISVHGGFAGIARKVPVATASVGIKVDMVVGGRGSYEIELVPGRDGREFEVENEWFMIDEDEAQGFHAFRGVVTENEGLFGRLFPPDEVGRDRLYLPVAAARAGYARTVFDRLRAIIRYNFELEELRQPQRPLGDATLGPAGQHLGDVLGRLTGQYKERLDAYIQAIVPDALGVDRWPAGSRVTVRLRTQAGPDGPEAEFGPDAMSDGTLRATALLAAIFQQSVRDGTVPVVAVEEPETALHPAAAGVLFDALTEASENVQVIATSQSADLFDREEVDPSMIRPVVMRDGLTIIGEVDEVSREIAEDKLYTLGELMRRNQFVPEPPEQDGGQET